MESLMNIKEEFFLEKDVAFLNHGSFGACPKKVFETYQFWQKEMELQPVKFMQRRLPDLLFEARKKLGSYVGAAPEDLVYVTNVSMGLNIVLRSLDLKPGDEILTTNHEYGTLDRAWRMICEQKKLNYVPREIPLPVKSVDEVVDQVWSGVTPRTRVLYLSHITSPTALTLPVAELVAKARAAGIITIVDGAHAPGQVPINLTELGVDFYSANCHKWMMAAKGSGFLYVRRELHNTIAPLIGGRNPEQYALFSSQLVAEHQYQGTRDSAAFLSVPAAIDFMEEYDWPQRQKECHDLVCYARNRVADLTGLPPVIPDSPLWFSQMGLLPVPPCEGDVVKNRLFHEFQVEIPFIPWEKQHFFRISIQAYNTRDDVDRLVAGLKHILY
jgi:isopenicillin-N epimerase